MGIDWFTLIAQIINFLVLVWLLKRFLYGRIVRAMNERAAGIARQLAEAADQRAEAEQEVELYRAKNRELKEQSDGLVNQAKQEAAALRDQLIATAQAESEELRAQWLAELHREQAHLLQDMRERIGQQVIAIARRTLKELASAELEEQVLRVFMSRVEAACPRQRGEVNAALPAPNGEIEVCTTFPLAEPLRKQIVGTVKKHFGESAEVRFADLPGLILGVELRAQSRRLAWNVESYLEGLEERVFETLDRNTGSYDQPV